MTRRNALYDVVACHCGGDAPLEFTPEGLRCGCGRTYPVREDVLRYASDAEDVTDKPEARVRDAQAKGYAQHDKFPVQIDRFKRYLVTLPEPDPEDLPVLDLGCGPWPTTHLLLCGGYNVVGVDFSSKSLQINRGINRDHADRLLLVHGDLEKIGLRPDTVGHLIIADILQHIIDHSARRRLLHTAFKALVPGGHFFISYFNLNIINYLKGDVHGAFSGGRIPYERMTQPNMLDLLPDSAEVHVSSPMNVFRSPWLDRIASAMPFAGYVGRMMIVTGRQRGG